jgi:hypothetical protein
MLFYSLFPEEKLCIFSVAGELSLSEMRLCLQELATEPAWPDTTTIVADLRGCYNVDVKFTDEFGRYRMERNAFGNRRLFWLTGSSTVMGKLAMAANEKQNYTIEPRVFQNKLEMGRCLGPEGAGIMKCLDELD